MTRLGHILTILATALAPLAAGSAYAQSPDGPVVVLPPQFEVRDLPRIELPFDFDLKIDQAQIDKAVDLARLADLGRIGKDFAQLTEAQRDQIDSAKERAREAMDRAREAVRESGMR